VSSLAAVVLGLVLAPCQGRAQGEHKELRHLSDTEVIERLAFIEESLAAQRGGAIAWWTGWMSFNVFNTAFAWTRFASAEKPVARDALAGSAVGASLFVLANGARPLPSLYAARRFRSVPGVTAEERSHRLTEGIRLMERTAKAERSLTGVGAHLSALLFASGAASYVYFRNMHEERKPLVLAVSLEFLVKMAVAEVTLWTVPRKGRRDLARFRSRFGDLTPPRASTAR
jgi:hypothetical protein